MQMTDFLQSVLESNDETALFSDDENKNTVFISGLRISLTFEICISLLLYIDKADF